MFSTFWPYKCASRHSGVPFFDIKPPKSGSVPVVFPHFDLQICFAPQRRAIFEHRNFQNGSGNVVFCAFWLANVLFATAAWHFGTSELPKWLRQCGVLCILTCKCAFRHSRVPFFTCPRNSYLRTRRFSELLFEHQEPRLIEKTQRFATSLTFGAHVELLATDSTRMLIFLLVTLHWCWSSCYWHDCCATLLFNSTYCRKLDF